MTNPVIIYEQPVNELMRLCLRLEYCFDQTSHFINKPSTLDNRAALSAMIETLNILDRPDLRAKLVSEFQRHYENLQKLQHSPHLDEKKLNRILDEIGTILHQLHATQGRFGQKLRDNIFLEQIRSHITSTNTHQFDTPALHFWLEQDENKRIEQLTTWYKEFELIESTTRLLLTLTRESNRAQAKVAKNGFYEQTLDSQLSNQLIRVALNNNLDVYPEISAGRHRLCIRFVTPQFLSKEKQISDDITFNLTCCII